MNQSTPVIILTGGGSGGHITPLLSLARELKVKSPNCQIIYVGHKGDKFDSFETSHHDFDFLVFIKAGKFRRYQGASPFKGTLSPKTLALNIRDLFRLPGSVMSAYRLMNKFKPDVVFSKGGFVALPVGIAAHLKGVSIVTHDSDTIPGLANRIIGRWATIHATGMPPENYDYPKSSIEYVGIPINQNINKVTPKLQVESKKALKIPSDAQLLVLSGGGNGSQLLNELLLSIAPSLLESNLALHIIHITGQIHQKSVSQAYQQILPKNIISRVKIFGFSPDFYKFCAAADLVISRAGATTLAELAAAGRACIIIPANFLTGGHQLKNAEELERKDAAVIIKHDPTADELLVVTSELLSDDHRRWELAKNFYGTARPQATKKLADIILRQAKVR